MEYDTKKSTCQRLLRAISKHFRTKYLCTSRRQLQVHFVDCPLPTPNDNTQRLRQHEGASIVRAPGTVWRSQKGTSLTFLNVPVTGATPMPRGPRLTSDTSRTSVELGTPGMQDVVHSKHFRSGHPNILVESTSMIPELTLLDQQSASGVTRGQEASTSSTVTSTSTHDPEQPSSAGQILKNVARGVLGVLSSASAVIPVPGVKGIFDTINQVIGAIEVTQTNLEAFKNLEVHCKRLLETVMIPLQTQSEIAHTLQSNLVKLDSELRSILDYVENQLRLGTMIHFINNQDDLATLSRMTSQIAFFLDFYSATLLTHVQQIIISDREKQAIEKLSKVKAGYDDHTSGIPDRPSCFAGTRVQLLEEIKSWIHDQNTDRPIYVLYGIAGIGKTTVAQSIAEYAAGLALLGGSFFFSRAEDERRTGDHFFSTLAFQLAQHNIILASHIAATLLNTPDIWHKTLDVQMKYLVVDPIKNAKLQVPLILVIDAFDECTPSDARKILNLLARNVQDMPNIKIFLATRPESHIQTVLADKTHMETFLFHEIEVSVAKGDIRLYLQHALSKSQIAKYLHSNEWEPKLEDLELLVDKCGVLFIMASTAVKYILDEYLQDPPSQMSRLLSGLDVEEGELGVMTFLDRMYMSILKSSIPARNSAGYIENFQRVVGTIVVLEDHLSIASLAHLLDMKNSDVIVTLQNLHSILAPVSSSQAPQLYHKSFPDFITNNERCKDSQFHIVLQVHNAWVTCACFTIMDKHLHSNMYNLKGTQKYMSNAEIEEKGLNVELPNELKYACIYWAVHLSKAGSTEANALYILLNKFIFTHLLHWIEVLSLVGRLDVVYPALKLTQQTLMRNTNSNLTTHSPKTGTQVPWNKSQYEGLEEMLNDGCRCVTKFYEIIRGSALHIYHSALPFLPLKSQIYTRYASTVKDLPVVARGQKDSWDPLLATLEGHKYNVRSITFSPDGSKIASGSSDHTVKLWDSVTGAYLATLEGHSESINTILFSPDGTKLASSSDDRTIRLWDGILGASVRVLVGHSGWVNSVTFSPNSSKLASSSDDKTIRLWDACTGASIATLEGHLDSVKAVVFSSDGLMLVSGSDDRTIKLWNVITGVSIMTLEGHSGWIRTVALSPNGSQLASGSFDKMVRLWDISTGVCISILRGHLDTVNTVVFSPDGSKLASGSNDSVIKLWDSITGICVAALEGHSGWIRTIVFSPNGSKLASGSDDGTVKLWDGVNGANITTLGGHSAGIKTIMFSPDGFRLASGSDDKTIKLWEHNAGASNTVLEGHSSWVTSVAFSPDGSRVASGSDDRTLKLWNGFTGTLIETLEGHSGWIRTIIFSQDTSRLASGSDDNTVSLWNGITGAPITTLKGHTSWINTIAFSSDGSRLASGSADGIIKLWNGVTGVPIATLEGHSHWLGTIAFSSDGCILASKNYSGHMKYWNGFTGHVLVHYKPSQSTHTIQ